MNSSDSEILRAMARAKLNLTPLNLNAIPDIPAIIPPVHSGAPNQVIQFGGEVVMLLDDTDAVPLTND